MNNIDGRNFEDLEALNARTKSTYAWWRVRCGKLFGWLLQPGSDLQYLNAHLRRDAGIDEIELEQDAIRKAPLIR
jgi:hypothetical protein